MTMTKRVIHQSMWERTPWYLRLIGKPTYRRKVAYLLPYDIIDPLNYVWEYDN